MADAKNPWGAVQAYIDQARDAAGGALDGMDARAARNNQVMRPAPQAGGYNGGSIYDDPARLAQAEAQAAQMRAVAAAQAQAREDALSAQAPPEDAGYTTYRRGR